MSDDSLEETPTHTHLATIEQIKSLSPIPNADLIEKAQILGYNTVVKKGEFEVGQFVVWHHPDTICPSKPSYAFLEKDNYRLKARKMRGVVSQGLILSLKDALGEDESHFHGSEEGTDVTTNVGIRKYQKPEFDYQDRRPLNAGKKSHWPGFLHRTDEPNIRGKPMILEELNGKEVVITQKIDGSSATFFFKEGSFGVCSRNMMIEPTKDNDYWCIAHKYDLPDKLERLSTEKGIDLCVQGELYGPKIQMNKLGLKERALALFNLFDITHGCYLGYDDLVDAASKLDVPVVPLIQRELQFQFTMEELIKIANSQKYPNKRPAEGIVVRPVKEMYSPILKGRLSGKVLSENFALKYGE